MVEFSRIEGYIPGGLNSTFITLIPPKNKPTNFGEFRPIVLCNLAYKLISKIILVRLNPILSRCISAEQFGFLKDRQILDAIGITQEIIHSVKKGNMKAMLLKMDLEKAYDRVEWVFLRMVLIQIGIPPLALCWIMVCVSTTNIVVLVNGALSDFF